MSVRKKVFIFQPKIQPPLLPTHRQDRCTSRDVVLPTEVLLRLFKYLPDPKDRASCRHVCRAWYEVMNDYTLWFGRTVCLKKLLNVPRYCWDLLKKRRPSRFQIRLSAKTPRQLQLAFEQLRRLIADVPHVTSLHLLVNSNIDFTGLTVAMTMFECLQTLAFTNISSHSKALVGLEIILDYATSLTELEIAGFRRSDLLSASHPDLVVLKLSLREAIDPAQLSILLKQLPRLKHLELSTSNAVVDGKFIRKRIRMSHPWFLVEDEDGAGDLQGTAKLRRIETLVLRCIRDVPSSEIVSLGLPTRMADLTSLSVLDCDFSKEALARLVMGQCSLTHLNLSGTQCSDDVLKSLASCCPVRSLELGMCVNVTMEGLKHVSKMAECDLTHLGLSHCTRVEPEGVALLPVMFPSLVSLDLSGLNLSSKTLKKLTQRTQLRTLVLRGSNTTLFQDSLQARRCSIIT